MTDHVTTGMRERGVCDWGCTCRYCVWESDWCCLVLQDPPSPWSGDNGLLGNGISSSFIRAPWTKDYELVGWACWTYKIIIWTLTFSPSSLLIRFGVGGGGSNSFRDVHYYAIALYIQMVVRNSLWVTETNSLHTQHSTLPTLSYPRSYSLLLPSYLSEGFLHLQQLVGQAIIQWKAGIPLEPIDVSVRVS